MLKGSTSNAKESRWFINELSPSRRRSAQFLAQKYETLPLSQVDPVVASNTRNLLFVDYTIVRRPTGHEHARPVLSEHACDPTANAEGSTGNDSDFAVQISHWDIFSCRCLKGEPGRSELI